VYHIYRCIIYSDIYIHYIAGMLYYIIIFLDLRLLKLVFVGSILFRLGIAQFQMMMCCGDLLRKRLLISKIFIF